MSIESTEFGGLTVFLLASDETELLKQTYDKIVGNCSADDLSHIIIVLKSNDCQSAETANELVKSDNSGRTELYFQKSENLRGCIGELPYLATDSHFIIMGSDAEMDPDSLPDLIEQAHKHPDAIICASKLLKDSVLKNYGHMRKFLNKAMNLYISLLYNKRVTDVFNFYQIYPIKVFNMFDFKKPKDVAYLFTIIPLRAKIPYYETPTVFCNNDEKKSHFGSLYVLYVGLKFSLMALRIRFTKVKKLLK